MLVLASIQQSTMIGFSCTQFWLCHFHIAVSNTLKHPLFIVYFWSACFTACSHQSLTKLKNIRCVSYSMKSSSKPLRNKNVHHVSQNDIDMIFALKLLHFSISYRFFFSSHISLSTSLKEDVFDNLTAFSQLSLGFLSYWLVIRCLHKCLVVACWSGLICIE